MKSAIFSAYFFLIEVESEENIKTHQLSANKSQLPPDLSGGTSKEYYTALAKPFLRHQLIPNKSQLPPDLSGGTSKEYYTALSKPFLRLQLNSNKSQLPPDLSGDFRKKKTKFGFSQKASLQISQTHKSL